MPPCTSLVSTYTFAVNTARSSHRCTATSCGRAAILCINGLAISHNASGTTRSENSSNTRTVCPHAPLHPHETDSNSSRRVVTRFIKGQPGERTTLGRAGVRSPMPVSGLQFGAGLL